MQGPKFLNRGNTKIYIHIAWARSFLPQKDTNNCTLGGSSQRLPRPIPYLLVLLNMDNSLLPHLPCMLKVIHLLYPLFCYRYYIPVNLLQVIHQILPIWFCPQIVLSRQSNMLKVIQKEKILILFNQVFGLRIHVIWSNCYTSFSPAFTILRSQIKFFLSNI